MNAIEFLHKASGNMYDVCTKFFFDYIKDDKITEDDKKSNLKQLLVWDYFSDKSLNIEEFYSQNEYKELIEKNREIIEQLVDNLVNKRVREKDFYDEIWNVFSNESLFANDDDRIGAILNLFDNPYIPYYELVRIEIESNDYQSKIDLLPYMRKYFFINNLKDKRIEKATYWYNLINEIDSDEKKVIFLSMIMDYYDFKIDKIIQKYKQDKENDE